MDETTRLFRLTAFSGVTDTLGVQRALPWADLVRWLSKPRTVATKKQAPLWSPATWPEGRSAGSTPNGAFDLYVGDYDGAARMSGEEALATCKEANIQALMHETAQSTPEAPRYRLVLALGQPAALVRGGLGTAGWGRGWEALEELVPGQDRSHHGEQFFVPASVGGMPQPPVLTVEGALWAPPGLAPQGPTPAQRWTPGGGTLDRAALAQELGGRVVGLRVENVPCPLCGRASVWWYTEPRSYYLAACAHKESCGWYGPLASLRSGG